MDLLGDKPTIQLSHDQRIDWLCLIRTENVGPISFRRLLNRFGSAKAALENLPNLSQNGGRARPITSPPRAKIEDELAAFEKIGVRLVAIGEADYPPLLEFIHGAPPLIGIKGGENINWKRTIGIVGARNASAAGRRITKLIAGDLADAGYTVISGLARGIDTAAHQASIRQGTVAVLAGGFDHIYPEENIDLAAQIIDQGGALISEMPQGWEPRARDFPRRNRLVSGLSLGITVIEAAKRSGSLITARLALEQNRDVFAVPGSPLDPRAEGPNSLIQQGATLVTSAREIIEALSQANPVSANLFEDSPDFTFPTTSDQDISAQPSQDDRSLLLDALSVTPISVDELVQQTGITAGSVQVILMEFDLAGRLEWGSGQLVCLKE